MDIMNPYEWIDGHPPILVYYLSIFWPWTHMIAGCITRSCLLQLKYILYIYYIYIQCICPITVHYISRYAAICPLNPYHCDGWYLAPFFISSLTKSHHCIPTCVGILYHYLPSLNQTWQWTIHNVRMIFKSINLHWVGRFSSLPRLITRW